MNTANAPLLGRIQSNIILTPQQFDIHYYHRGGDIYPGATDKASGTACFIGWAVVLEYQLRLSEMRQERIRRLGCDALNVGNGNTDMSLVYICWWPEQFKRRLIPEPSSYDSYLHNALVACQRISDYLSEPILDLEGYRGR